MVDEKTNQLLRDLVQTAKDLNFDMDATMSKFPEFQNVDRQLLDDFVQTAKDLNYDIDLTLSKFPEITGEKGKEVEPGKTQDPTVYRGVPYGSNTQEPIEQPSSQQDGDPIKEQVAASPAMTPMFPEKEKKEPGFLDGDKDKSKFYESQAAMKLDAMTPAQQEEEFGKGGYMRTREYKLGVLKGKLARGESMDGDTVIIPPEFQSKKQKDEIKLSNKSYEDEIDLGNMKTVVDKKFGDVKKVFDEYAGFPGLNVINNSVGLDEKVKFILPDGEVVDVDLYPTGPGDDLFNTKAGVDAKLAEVKKLERIKEWYSDPKNKKKTNLGLFRVLGDRSDDWLGDNFPTNLTPINDELSRLNYRIKIDQSVEGEVGAGGNKYRLVDVVTNRSIAGGSAGDIQQHLFNNLSTSQLNQLKDNNTELTKEVIEQYRQQKSDRYDYLVSSPSSSIYTLKTEDSFPDKVNIALDGLDISTRDRQIIKAYLNNAVTNTGDLLQQAGASRNKYKEKNKAYAEMYDELVSLTSANTFPGSLDITRAGDEPSQSFDLDNPEKVLSELKSILTLRKGSDSEGLSLYNNILSEEVVNSQHLSNSNDVANTWLSLLSTSSERGGGSVSDEKLNSAGVSDYRPEMLSALIDEAKRDQNYMNKLGGMTDTYLKIDGSYDELYSQYKKRGEEINKGSKADIEVLLKDFRDDGLGYENVDGKLVIIGTDKKAVNIAQGRWNELMHNQAEVNSAWNTGLSFLNAESNEFAGDVFSMGGVVDREYNYGALLAKDFWGGASSFVEGIPAFFGSGDALRAMESGQRGEEAYEMMYDYQTAWAEGMTGRYVGRVGAQQSVNLAVALGTQFIPGVGAAMNVVRAATAPTLFGLSAGGQQRSAINQQVDTGRKAKLALKSLEKDYKIGAISQSMYLDNRVRLETSVALGDLNILQRNGSVLAAGMIEGGITYIVGTVPNARAAMKNLSGIVDRSVHASARTRWGAARNFLGQSSKQVGGEVLEEEAIYFSNELQAGVITGREMDFTHWDDVLIASLIVAGPMNTTTTAYGTVMQQVANEQFREQVVPQIEKVGEIHNAIKEAALKSSPEGEAEVKVLRQGMTEALKQMGLSNSAMEVNAILSGTAGIETLLDQSMAENAIHQKAGIKPQDTPRAKKMKLKKYRATLSGRAATAHDATLKTIEDTRARVYAETESKFDNVAEGKGGIIESAYGQAGLDVAADMVNPESPNFNPKFNRMDNKQKVIAVHEKIKAQYNDHLVAEAKADANTVKNMELAVYGREGGSTTLADGKTKRTRRKRKAENEYFQLAANWGTSRSTHALSIASKGRVNARNILQEEVVEGMNENSIEEFADNEAMAQDVLKNWKKKYGYVSEVKAQEVAKKIRDGKIVAQVVVDAETNKAKYITLNKADALNALMQGDLLQGTAYAHEVGHVLDAIALTDAEIELMAIGLEESLNGEQSLQLVNAQAIRRMTNVSDGDSKLQLENNSRPWNPNTNKVDWRNSKQLAKEEYIRAVGDILGDGYHAHELKQARKIGKQGIKNLFREKTGKRNFKFDSKGAALNYLVGYLDAFNKGEISQQTRRKIAAKKMMSDEQLERETVGRKQELTPEEVKNSERAIKKSNKEASERVQNVYDEFGMDGIQEIIDEFEVIVNPGNGNPKGRFGLVEKYRSRFEIDELPFSLGRTMQERRNAIAQAIYLDKRGIYGMVEKYNSDGQVRTDDQGNKVPLAGYINKYIEKRADEIVNDLLQEEAVTRIDETHSNIEIEDDSGTVEMERRSKGVKLYERFGEDGLGIHSSIFIDVLNGDINVDGKNYKTLGGKRFYQVMEMMGINPVNKAGKPKTGNLDATDVTNAQRWIQKNIQSVRGAVIPMHSTTKMVKNPNTGKLEARPDKAVGIPQVLLDSDLFTKHTRKDNLTGYSFNDNLTDAEITRVFGITERGTPNIKPKDDRNVGQRIRALVKLVDMAMTNQAARAAMDQRGDPISEVLSVADGRNLNLFSERAATESLHSYLVDTPVDQVQDQMVEVMKIAFVHGYHSPDSDRRAEFENRLDKAGIPQDVLAYLDSRNFGRYFTDENTGFNAPIKKALLSGKWKDKHARKVLLDLVNNPYQYTVDGVKYQNKKALKDLENSSIALMQEFPPQFVRKLGRSFFVMGSSRGLSAANAPKFIAAYEAKIKEPDMIGPMMFDINAVSAINAGKLLSFKIQKIQAEDYSDLSKEEGAKRKRDKVNRLYGKDIDAANENNIKALKYMIETIAEFGKTRPDLQGGLLRMLQGATNNVNSFRSYTSISLIQYSNKPQTVWKGINKKTGKTVYFAKNPTKVQKENHDIAINDNHPEYKAALKYAKVKAKEKSKKKGWNSTMENEVQAQLAARLRIKGEHITPSANMMQLLATNIADVWYNNGSITTATENAMSGFSQSLGTEIYSRLQDDASGSTSPADMYRMVAIQGNPDIDVDSFKTSTGDLQYSEFVRAELASKARIQESLNRLDAIRKGDSKSLNNVTENLGAITKGATDVEVQNTINDARRATAKNSERGETKGMSAWDFDDTLAMTSSEVITTSPDGVPGKLTAEEFATDGARLKAEGYVFDFSEFNKVVGGKPGPLFDKALERSKKFGTEDTYILTARSPEAAPAIKEFLDAVGLDIPLKNITGLGKSEGSAKARWILNKFAEGYNDIYFADDAIQNVDAVQQVYDEFDIKGKVEQAKVKFSERANATMEQVLSEGQLDLDEDFNIVLEETKGVDRRKEFSAVKAQQRGKNKGKFKFFIPPSAEDFAGLLYSFMGKGEIGNKHHAFFKENLFDPFSRGIRRYNSVMQETTREIREARKAIPGINGKLKKKIAGTDFTNEHAVRVYNWSKAGIDIPGLSRTDQKILVDAVAADVELEAFSESILNTSNKLGVDFVIDSSWLIGNISSDINEQMRDSRSVALSDFLSKSEVIFSEKNLNKIQAIYGNNFREALEDSLYRMEHGGNRSRNSGRIVNALNQWVTSGAVGTTMFFNTRSAILQLTSAVNFVNWSDNNPLEAGKAIVNQKQYWGDVAMIFNSPFMKARRGGLQTDVNANELLEDLKGSKNPFKSATAYLLKLGFTPTKIADSFAIATGGATFYRNRIKTYLKDGMNQTEAESKAFEDMMELAEETQQSSREDRVSQQQASGVGKFILAFQNTPMQMNRLTKKASLDLINGRGDAKANISRIIYYSTVQSAIFYGLQGALFASLFGDDEEDEITDEKQQRLINGMMDSLLRGSGVGGAVVATLKNTILRFMKEDKKSTDDEFMTEADHAYTIIEALNISPPIGIKARKLYGAAQTWEFNRDVISHMSKTNINNPVYDATFAAVESTTNIPLSRLYSKMENIKAAMDSDNETWKRVAMALGWNKWNFGIKNQDVITARGEVKEIKSEAAEVRREERRLEREEERAAENAVIEQGFIEDQAQERADGKEDVTCTAVNNSGVRCKVKAVDGGTRCTIHQEVEQRADGEKKQCSHVKSDGKRCKIKTTNQSGKCYYHD